MTRAAGAGVVALCLVLSARSTGAHDPATIPVTFAREIRAILSARCVTCHAPGGSAPMALTTIDELRPWARAIKEQVLTRRMPKWHAARGFGAFTNDPTLTPFEQALIVAWIDRGLPEGTPRGTRANAARPIPPPVASADDAVVRLLVAARADVGRVTLDAPRWITGWTFEPGDPLITAAVISIDGVTAGAWVAGDGPTRLPAGIAFKAAARLRTDVRRRAPAEYEQPFLPRRSTLTFLTDPSPSLRRAWTEQLACGSDRTGRAADLLAVRPLLDRAEARLSVSRAGAPAVIVGWFRDFDPLYPRTYWLRRPADFGADARIVAEGPCRVEVTLVAQRPPDLTARQ